MAITRTQSNHLEATGAGPSIGQSLTGVAVGALVVESITVGDPGTVSTVTDDLSVAGAVASQADNTTDGQKKEIWYHKNHGGGTRTFTANFSGTPLFRSIVVMEYAGADKTTPLGGVATNTGNSTTPSSGNVSPVPSVNGCLVVGGAYGGGQPAFASPFSEVFQDTTNFGDTEDYIQPTAGAIAATWTQPSAQWAAVAAVFVPAATGGGWVGSGSRRAPGQRGPFDARGFLASPYNRYNFAESAVAAATTLQRKTLSPLGTHTGGRQSQ